MGGGDDSLTNYQTLLPPLTSCPNDPPNHLEFTLVKRETVEESPQNNGEDSQLVEELLDSVSVGECNSNPIPLLTPPATPVTLKSDDSVVQICEWPYNLTVDNALTSAIQLRALSPSSLVKLEETVHPEAIH